MSSTQREERWVYRVGGASAIALGFGYVITVVLYALVGPPPSHGAEWLKYGADKTSQWWVILALSVLTDALYIPVSFALYLAHRKVSAAAMVLALGLIGLFIVLDLSVTWSNYASLITLSGQYASATTDLQRSAYVAAATYATSVLSSRLDVVYSIVDLSLGILVVGMVMMRSRSHRITAYTGVATGLLGVLAITSFSPVIMANAVCATIWALLVGYMLLGLAGTRSPDGPAATLGD